MITLAFIVAGVAFLAAAGWLINRPERNPRLWLAGEDLNGDRTRAWLRQGVRPRVVPPLAAAQARAMAWRIVLEQARAAVPPRPELPRGLAHLAPRWADDGKFTSARAA